MAKFCTKCKKEVLDDNAKFCPYCGNDIRQLITCPQCGMCDLPNNAKFCPTCGTSLSPKKETSPTNIINHSTQPSQHPTSSCGTSTYMYGKEAVDLGLSALWSTCNIEASNVLSNGLNFTWGDPTRKTITSKMANWFKSPPGLSNICGHAEYDMAAFYWGGQWQLPTCEHCIELIENCSWKVIRYRGENFYQVKSYENGNFILMPLSIKLWIGDRAIGGCVHYLDTKGPNVESEFYNIDHAYYVRPVIPKDSK